MTRDELVEKATHIVVECMRRDRSYKWTPDKMLTSILSLVDMEREACAKVCEQLGMATNGMNERNYECAEAIRVRGEK